MKRSVAIAPIALVMMTVAGCGGGSSSPAADSSPTSTTSATPTTAVTATAAPTTDLAVGGCRRSQLPAHYIADSVHSGKLDAHTYSAAADVQAALEYDQLTAGGRRVYVRPVNKSVQKADGVISCVELQFPSAHLAGRFFLSYKALRQQAGSLVHTITPAKPIKGLTGTTAYFEKEQSFRGYGISSTNVIEVAGQAGNTLFITSVAGASPSVALARTLAASIVSQA